MKKLIYTITISSLLIFSCSNVSEDDLIDNTPIENVVTYNANIKPILDNNCVACHSNPPLNGASTSYDTYESARLGVENNIINRISKQVGESGAMPIGGPRLPQASIDLFQQWLDEGFLEN